jgi:hypothetical protein
LCIKQSSPSYYHENAGKLWNETVALGPQGGFHVQEQVEVGGRYRRDASLRPPPTASSELVDVIPVETQQRKRGLMLEVWDGNWVAAEAMEVVALAKEGSGDENTKYFSLSSLFTLHSRFSD